jgi:hypothetical protein
MGYIPLIPIIAMGSGAAGSGLAENGSAVLTNLERCLWTEIFSTLFFSAGLTVSSTVLTAK